MQFFVTYSKATLQDRQFIYSQTMKYFAHPSLFADLAFLIRKKLTIYYWVDRETDSRRLPSDQTKIRSRDPPSAQQCIVSNKSTKVPHHWIWSTRKLRVDPYFHRY